jgi:hypothetical protein
VPTIDLHKYWDALKPVFLDPQLPSDALFRHVAVWLGICVMIEKIVGDRRAGGLIGRFAGFLIFACVLNISTHVTLAQIAGIAVAFVVWRLLPSFAARVRTAAVLMGAYAIVFRLHPFVFSARPGPFGWVPFLSFMQGSVDVDVQSFFEKVFLYGGLIWLLAGAGLAMRLSTLLVTGIVLAASFIQVFIPGRSAEITDAILAMAVGEIIRALEVAATDRVRPDGPFAATRRPALTGLPIGETLDEHTRTAE